MATTMRVARVDRGALLLVGAPDDPGRPDSVRRDPGRPDAAPDAAEPRPGVLPAPVRAELDRDGLVPAPDGERLAPTVGDLVVTERRPGGALHATGLARRRSVLVRDTAGQTSRVQPLAANVDVVVLAEHLDPDPDLGRVERLLALAWRSGATPVVVLTKADLVPDAPGMAADVARVAPGAEVHVVSATAGEGLDPLRALLAPGVSLVVVGPSGAGKSTLVNALAGAEVVQAGAGRSDGKGRHTTTQRTLIPLPGGAMLIDTPGLRGVGVVGDDAALATTFADVAGLAASCRFRDCHHRTEPGCAVREALESGELPERRYESWLRLAKEAAWQARRSDARLAAVEKARWKRRTAEHHRAARKPGA